MHDVPDPRDQVPDEAEQLLHSGYAVNGLLRAARAASRLSDLSGLAEIANSLARAQRSPDWPYDEPSESSQPIEVRTGLPVLADLAAGTMRLADRIRAGA
jgi:hypothetical protein